VRKMYNKHSNCRKGDASQSSITNSVNYVLNHDNNNNRQAGRQARIITGT
jgi:hypothetical protein